MVRDEHIRKVRSLAGSLGGNPKIKGYPKSTNLVKQTPPQTQETLVKQIPTPSSSVLLSSTTKIIKKGVDIPEWINKETWDAFVEMRKVIKKPMTQRAVVLMVNKLERFKNEGHIINEILNQSIINNWQDVFELRGTDGKRQGKSTGGNRIQKESLPEPLPERTNEDLKRVKSLIADLEKSTTIFENPP